MLKHLTIEGTSFEKGTQQGKAWAKEIKELAKIRKALLLEAFKKAPHKLEPLLASHIEVLKKHPDLWDEAKGICETANISQEGLMILNNYTDLRDFVDLSSTEEVGECSCFAIKTNEGVIAGQTWDMHGSALPFVAHLTVKDGSSTQEIFTLTGCFGLTGINSHGIGVFINNLRSSEVAVGLAWPALIRKILSQHTLIDAVATIKKNMPSAGRNFILADNSEALCLEVTGKRVSSCGDLSKGYLIHTNHYTTELKTTEDLELRSKTTVDRMAFLEKRIPEILKKTNELNSFSRELFIGEASKAICFSCDDIESADTATCGGMVYDFAQSKGLSFKGLLSENKIYKF